MQIKTVRGIRGAVIINTNTREDIAEATKELIKNMMDQNEIKEEDIISVFFAASQDINFEFPALCVMEMGEFWKNIPMLSSQEINVPNAMQRCLRALVLCHTEKSLFEIHHIYLGEASKMRPDLFNVSVN